MKIIILGGTGFVGSFLKPYLQNLGHQVEAYGRKAFASGFNLSGCLENADLVMMLAGENVGQRWSARYKKALIESRTLTNQALQQAITDCESPPKRVFCASAIGIYPENSCEQPIDETCTEIGSSFLGKIGQEWEAAANKITPKPVILRFGVVLGKGGGALQKMLPAFKLGLGGPVAGGQQCFSWVHIEDLARAVVYLIDHPEKQGVFNVTAPNPVTNEVFGKALAKTLNRPFFLPLPAFQLKLMFGEGAQVLTHSSAILPKKLLEAGFTFKHQEIREALNNIVKA